MNAEVDLWRLAAGLGLFLFGMHQLEMSLNLLTGRPFKKFLREHPAHPVKGVLAGAVSTAALQSSSVVSLIVLAFVGTGIISLASAIVIFLPSIGLMSRQLAKRFGKVTQSLLRHIKISDIAVPEAAVENISRETYRLVDQAAALNQISFELPPEFGFYDSEADRQGIPAFQEGAEHSTSYAGIKQLEGEILTYALRLQEERLDADESVRLGQVIPAVRNAVHAAKCIKDTHHDLRLFRESVDDRYNAWFGGFRDAAQAFFAALDGLRGVEEPSHRFATLVDLKNANEALHAKLHADIYHEVALGQLSEVKISTLLNVNRELYSSNQSLLTALADILLDAESAADYESIPVSN